MATFSFSPRKETSIIQTPEGESIGLEEMRHHLRQSTTGHTVQISASTFLERHATLPQLTDKESNTLVNYVARKLRGTHLDDNGWPNTEIVDSMKEDAIFANLTPIADAIWMACTTWDQKKGKLGDTTSRMECNPRQRTNSEVSGGSMMADAQFILTHSTTPKPRPTSHRTDTANKAGGGEFKKYTSERAQVSRPSSFRSLDSFVSFQNEDQLVGGVAHMLHNDPARRFVIVFTIEGVEMRFWYFSRSHIAVSEAFDYHKVRYSSQFTLRRLMAFAESQIFHPFRHLHDLRRRYRPGL